MDEESKKIFQTLSTTCEASEAYLTLCGKIIYHYVDLALKQRDPVGFLIKRRFEIDAFEKAHEDSTVYHHEKYILYWTLRMLEHANGHYDHPENYPNYSELKLLSAKIKEKGTTEFVKSYLLYVIWS